MKTFLRTGVAVSLLASTGLVSAQTSPYSIDTDGTKHPPVSQCVFQRRGC